MKKYFLPCLGLELLLVLGLVIGVSLPAGAATLWYNGDFNGVSGFANEMDTSVGQAAVYDDFIVPTGGWTINSVWSNNLMNIAASEAYWEIRTGVSSSNGGTLVANGTNSGTQIATGRTFDVWTEYTFQVTGLNVALPAGTYWLNVSPIGTGFGRSINTTTSGANAVGQPSGNNGNAFWNSSSWATNFLALAEDFSMGVGSTAVPIPAAFLLLGTGLAGVAVIRRRL